MSRSTASVLEGSGGRCRLLGVFAHPDDETFCAGGTFARYAEQGAEIMVVSATRGQAGQIRDAAVGNRRTIAAVREAELRLACERLGITKVRCLDHVDGTLADADFSALVDEVAEVICEFGTHSNCPACGGSSRRAGRYPARSRICGLRPGVWPRARRKTSMNALVVDHPQRWPTVVTGSPSASSRSARCSRSWVRHCPGFLQQLPSERSDSSVMVDLAPPGTEPAEAGHRREPRHGWGAGGHERMVVGGDRPCRLAGCGAAHGPVARPVSPALLTGPASARRAGCGRTYRAPTAAR